MGESSEHCTHEWGNCVQPEVVCELFVDKAGLWNVVTELDDLENGLGNADCGVEACARL